jgi:hypothetical protein
MGRGAGRSLRVTLRCSSAVLAVIEIVCWRFSAMGLGRQSVPSMTLERVTRGRDALVARLKKMIRAVHRKTSSKADLVPSRETEGTA